MLILVSMVAAYAVLTGPALSEPQIHIGSVITDKEVYQSNDRMEILIRVASSSAISDNLSLKVEGIVDTSGRSRLNETHQVILNQGDNEFHYTFIMPVCSRCAGLPAGNYSFNVSLDRENTTVSTAMHGVTIQ
jgi:hypothetical protein